MAPRRTHLGLRRGGPRLRTPAPAAHPLRAGAALLSAALALGACSSAQEQAKLELHQENCEAYYQQGDFLRALQQANLALAMDGDDVRMRIAKGLCLLRLGKVAKDSSLIDQSIDVFDDLVDEISAEEEYQAYLGHGSARLQRALAVDGPIAQQRTRLERGFLDEASRRAEEDLIDELVEQQREDLEVAEEAFREVLALPPHAENSYAMVDLVLVLNAADKSDEDMMALADRALELLAENSAVNAKLLENGAGLPTGTKLALERRIETNGQKERLLRDLLATVHFNRGELVPALEQLMVLADKGLMEEPQFYNRAAIYELLGRYDLAIADLQTFMRRRAAYLEYEDDTLAPEIFRKIDDLRAADARSRR